MTREQKAFEASKRFEKSLAESDIASLSRSDMCFAFQLGIKWADGHPINHWISVEEDLPCNHKELIHFGFTNNVLVIDDKQNTFIAFMKKYKDNEWIWDSANNFLFLPFITHWTPIPQLPKE